MAGYKVEEESGNPRPKDTRPLTLEVQDSAFLSATHTVSRLGLGACCHPLLFPVPPGFSPAAALLLSARWASAAAAAAVFLLAFKRRRVPSSQLPSLALDVLGRKTFIGF